MLGTDVVATLRAAGAEVTAADRTTLDVLDVDAVAAAVPGHDVVVNCAAWTKVDDAETQEPDAFALNAVAPSLLAAASRRNGARLIQISTDYVFDGHATQPYAEDGPVAPRSAYGRTKAAGEWATLAGGPDAMVVRTAWLYGRNGSCFPRTIARVAAERGGLDVVDDQVGQPTWTKDVARVVLDLVTAGAPGGIYHATSQGTASWFEFARAVVAAAGLDPEIVRPTTSDRLTRPAPRPPYSVLGHDRFADVGVAPVADWAQRWEAAAAEVLAPEQ
ncbi:NAD(P)-dependent oxidoreductase [Cellulomonas xylanilytica]|uniref:dTDP-4-dehydrorhamnose reductase n=2 Tax=Cellulomonas xylanilytica TaxID=233583 RepID=A0A510V443_9CELL|nr:NAD(P)-dependent oxidoreductase [Cellulomonas xylanilytica]